MLSVYALDITPGIWSCLPSNLKKRGLTSGSSSSQTYESVNVVSTSKGVERCCWFSLVWLLWTAVVTGEINISIMKYNTVHFKKEFNMSHITYHFLASKSNNIKTLSKIRRILISCYACWNNHLYSLDLFRFDYKCACKFPKFCKMQLHKTHSSK